jgi:hypothetical protein
MSDYLELHPDRGDDDVTRALRKVYAAPRDDGYWRDLEARILSAVAGVPQSIGWWDELDRWMRPALVAAGVVLLAAGVALFRARQAAEENTYDAMVSPTSLPIETAIRPVLQEPRETTFRYLVTH